MTPSAKGERRTVLAMTQTCLSIFVFAFVGQGCSMWTAPGPDKPLTLPRAQLTPDAVVLEVLTLRVPSGEQAIDPWRCVDEQVVSGDARKSLLVNGIRCGLIHGQLPHELQVLLDAQRNESSPIAEITNEKRPSGNEQRLQTRAGTRGKVVTTDVRDTMVVLTPGQQGLTGRSLQQAQGVLSARSYPQGDGSIEIELTPEVEHGQARQKWVGQGHDGTFRLDTNRECLSLDHLRLKLRIQPGQTLVLGPTPDFKGIGRQFFTDAKSDAPEQRLILIRLAQTQIDDLFAPEPTRAPLTTPVD